MEDHDIGKLIGVAVGGMIGLIIFLIPLIFYLLTLQKTLNRCSPESRAMQPGLVWLLLIPLFGLVWHFFIVLNMTKTLETEFRKRGLHIEAAPGKTLGLVMCILACCSIIPLLGFLCSLGALVCWILYWVKIAGYSKQLPSSSAPPLAG
ncbi:MAG: hypothetical protein M9920_01520 [Verrucomicrobiae bacterium]|nr:hypothetical protein [Verrucomicrobiae bacterium]